MTKIRVPFSKENLFIFFYFPKSEYRKLMELEKERREVLRGTCVGGTRDKVILSLEYMRKLQEFLGSRRYKQVLKVGNKADIQVSDLAINL